MQVMEALAKAANMEPEMEIRHVSEWNGSWYLTCMSPAIQDTAQMDCPRIRIRKDTGKAEYVRLIDSDFFESLQHGQTVNLPSGTLPYSAHHN